MSNAIEINGITIEAKFSNGTVNVTFTKDAKVVKTCHYVEVSRFVRPENLAKVQAIIEAEKESVDAIKYYAEMKANLEAYEAEYQERTGHYEARNAEIKKAMAI